MRSPFERCAVCGYRRFTHWLLGWRDRRTRDGAGYFYEKRSPLLTPPPRRGWFW